MKQTYFCSPNLIKEVILFLFEKSRSDATDEFARSSKNGVGGWLIFSEPISLEFSKFQTVRNGSQSFWRANSSGIQLSRNFHD